MPAIEIYMLGKFMILVDGHDIIEKLGNSKKKIDLLEFFILNRNKDISTFDLFDVLWPTNDNTNPESSLKTLISRLRADLKSFGLNDVVITKGSYYAWNENLNASIDVYELDELCSDVKSSEGLTSQTEEKYERILQLYQGDLLPHSNLEAWVIPKSMHYHNLYLNALQKYIVLLKETKRFEDIIHACRKGLEIDAFDSTLNLELMVALVNLGKNKEALEQYKCTIGMHYTYLGMKPSDEILDFYKKLIAIERTSGGNIDTILNDLLEKDNDVGAFICEYAIFKDIYRINMRNLKRLGTSMFLALVSLDNIDNSELDPIRLDKMMSELLMILKLNLRKGDTISRFSPYQYALLLPTVNYQSGQMVMERMKKVFYKQFTTSEFMLNYKLKLINQDN
ncbi:MAG: BTAD domain-containing putative transcriptional regulator [Anaerofustis sp.]